MVATVHDRNNDEKFTVQARYVIAADGGKTVGPRDGVEMIGPTNMVDMVSTHFTADLSQYWDDKTLITWFLNPEGEGSWGAAQWFRWGRRGAGTPRSGSFISPSDRTIRNGSTRTPSCPGCATCCACPTWS